MSFTINRTNSRISNPITEENSTTASPKSSLRSRFREARNSSVSFLPKKKDLSLPDQWKKWARENDEGERRDIAVSSVIDCLNKIGNGKKNVSLDLSHLHLKGNCPPLPEGITNLNLCGNPSMNPPERFPSTIEKLNITYNYWRELPKNLPKNLKIFDASHNKLTKVNANDLPEGIEDINFVTNELTEVTVPNSVTKLNVANNKLLAKPTLANGAEIKSLNFNLQRVTKDSVVINDKLPIANSNPSSQSKDSITPSSNLLSNAGFELLAPEMNQKTGQIANAIKDFGCEDGICAALSFRWAVEYALYGDITAFREKLLPDGILNVEELKGICELQQQLQKSAFSTENIENYLKNYKLKYIPIKESDTHDSNQETFHLKLNRSLGYTSILSVSNEETVTGLNILNTPNPVESIEEYSKALETNFAEPLQQYLLAATTPTTLVVYLQYTIQKYHAITFYTSGQADAEGKKRIVFGEPELGIHSLKVDTHKAADNAKLANGLKRYFLLNGNPLAFRVHNVEK